MKTHEQIEKEMHAFVDELAQYERERGMQPQPGELIGHLEDGTPVHQARQESAKGTPGDLNIEEDADTMNAVIEKRIAPVQGIIVEGLTLLCSKPKEGKSWLALQMCCAVANGRQFLGLPTDQGDVLYMGYEDSWRRLQDRLKVMHEKKWVVRKWRAAFDNIRSGFGIRAFRWT